MFWTSLWDAMRSKSAIALKGSGRNFIWNSLHSAFDITDAEIPTLAKQTSILTRGLTEGGWNNRHRTWWQIDGGHWRFWKWTLNPIPTLPCSHFKSSTLQSKALAWQTRTIYNRDFNEFHLCCVQPSVFVLEATSRETYTSLRSSPAIPSVPLRASPCSLMTGVGLSREADLAVSPCVHIRVCKAVCVSMHASVCSSLWAFAALDRVHTGGFRRGGKYLDWNTGTAATITAIPGLGKVVRKIHMALSKYMSVVNCGLSGWNALANTSPMLVDMVTM